MARRRRRTLPDRYRGQAELEAALRSAPQRRTLQDALDEAGLSRDSTIAAAHGTSKGLRASIRAARPEFAQLFADAASQLGGQNAVVMPSTAAGSSIAAAAATEHQGALDRNAVAQRDTLSDLDQQRIRASEGEGFAVRQAQGQYQQDAGKILKQLLGVSADEGDYAAATLGRLVESARDRGVTVRGQNLSHQDRVDDRTSRENIAGGKGAGGKANGGRGWATPEQHAKAQDTIQEALRWVKQLKDVGGLDRNEVASLLSNGRKAAPVYEEVDDGRGGKKRQPVLNKDGTPKMTPDVPKIGSQVLLSTALDEVFDGYVSRTNSRRLHKRRLRVRDLPVTSYEAWRRRNPPGVLDRPGNAPGANGQQRPT